MIQQIKELRVKIDGLHQLTKELKPIEMLKPTADHSGLYYNSKEIEESVKSLLLAKAWLGKLLGEIRPIIEIGKNFDKFLARVDLIKDVNLKSFPEYKFEFEIGTPVIYYDRKCRIVEVLDHIGIVRLELITTDPNDCIKIDSNPYTSGKKEVKDIEPITDTQDSFYVTGDNEKIGYWVVQDGRELSNHIEKVDWLRSEIQGVIDELSFRKGRTLNGINEEWFNYNAWNATNMAYNHLCEARMWLGFELGRVRDES